MPNKRQHQRKQIKARLALSDLQVSQIRSHHADWIVTLAFYKALHAVDSYLAHKWKIHPNNHQNRHMHVRQHLSNIYGDYSALFSASLKARYEENTYQSDPKEVGNLLKMSSDIENHIKALL